MGRSENTARMQPTVRFSPAYLPSPLSCLSFGFPAQPFPLHCLFLIRFQYGGWSESSRSNIGNLLNKAASVFPPQKDSVHTASCHPPHKKVKKPQTKTGNTQTNCIWVPLTGCIGCDIAAIWPGVIVCVSWHLYWRGSSFLLEWVIRTISNWNSNPLAPQQYVVGDIFQSTPPLGRFTERKNCTPRQYIRSLRVATLEQRQALL